MRDAPSREEMMSPNHPQSGEPNYADESAEVANNKFYPNRGEDAPAYVASDPRYWEYR